MSDSIEQDIPVRTRRIGQIESGVFVNLSYYPVRGRNTPNGRRGIVSETNYTEEGIMQFRFYDESRQREIEVTVGPTTGDSKVQSRRSERWTTLGTPSRVSLSEDAGDFGEYTIETLPGRSRSRYADIVAVAETKGNREILEWLSWSKQNA